MHTNTLFLVMEIIYSMTFDLSYTPLTGATRFSAQSGDVYPLYIMPQRRSYVILAV